MSRIINLLVVLGLLLSPTAFAGSPIGVTGKAKVKKYSGLNKKFLEQVEFRTVVLRGAINTEVGDEISAKLRELSDEFEPILLILRSPGGFIDAGMDIINAMETNKSRIVCAIDQEAASMAAIISLYCDSVYIHKYATLMFHEAQFRIQGSESLVTSRLNYLKQYVKGLDLDLLKQLNKRLRKAQTGSMSYLQYKQNIFPEMWLPADEAAKFGFVDGIIDTLEYDWTPPPKNPFGLIFRQIDEGIEEVFDPYLHKIKVRMRNVKGH